MRKPPRIPDGCLFCLCVATAGATVAAVLAALLLLHMVLL